MNNYLLGLFCFFFMVFLGKYPGNHSLLPILLFLLFLGNAEGFQLGRETGFKRDLRDLLDDELVSLDFLYTRPDKVFSGFCDLIFCKRSRRAADPLLLLLPLLLPLLFPPARYVRLLRLLRCERTAIIYTITYIFFIRNL